MKIVRNIFAVLTLTLLAPLMWHAIAPMALCWLQAEQIGVSIFGMIVFGLTAIYLHLVLLEGDKPW